MDLINAFKCFLFCLHSSDTSDFILVIVLPFVYFMSCSASYIVSFEEGEPVVHEISYLIPSF